MRFSDIITPMMISESGVIIEPTLDTTAWTGSGKWSPAMSMTMSSSVAMVPGVARLRRRNFCPVKALHCQVKNRALKATMATAL